MARDTKLFELSRNVLEPYVGYYLSTKRNKIKCWKLAEGVDDTDNKIDLFIDTIDGKHCPVQVKTRNIDSPNFSLGLKDIREEQQNRVVAFIDKTFSLGVVENMHDNMSIKDAKQLMLKEEPHVFIESQEVIQNGIKNNKFEVRYSKDKTPYYLIPKTFLKEVKRILKSSLYFLKLF